MIRISTIFIAICMVLVAASPGLVLHAVAGFSGTDSAIVALTALTFLTLYNALSLRLPTRPARAPPGESAGAGGRARGVAPWGASHEALLASGAGAVPAAPSNGPHSEP